MILWVMNGLPGSGKSTYANQLKIKKVNSKIISMDEFREQFLGSRQIQECNQDIYKIAFFVLEQAIKRKLYDNIIWDATSLTVKSRKPLIQLAKKYGIKIKCVSMLTPLEECIRRNEQREKEEQVPKEVIEKMYNYSIIPNRLEDFDEIIYIGGGEE